MLLSAIILTKNEEKNIASCMESLSWCDEIIVIDDNSGDATVSIAEKSGARVLVHPLENDFSAQRNFGLEKAKGEWVLFVDADERASAAFVAEIESLITSSKLQKNGYYIRRVDSMWGRELKHGEMGNIKLLRLARKNAGKWEGKVHEEWKIKGRIGNVKNPILHYPHRDMTEFLKEINFYSDLRAEELYNKKVHVSWSDIILYPKGKFLVNYFLKRGFLDGMPGFIVAMLMSFHSFLVRGKLWMLWEKK